MDDHSLARRAAASVAALTLAAAVAEGGGTPVIERVSPRQQRVGEMLTLHGEGFGRFEPGDSRVVVTRPGVVPGRGRAAVFDAGTPYVWRDDLIQVRVPAGDLVDGEATPVPRGTLAVRVIRGEAVSAAAHFRVILAPDAGALRFRELTEIAGHVDVSAVLGVPNMNLARTKDAEVGDVDGDGHPDLIDMNSLNIINGTRSVLRLNDGRGAFTALALEPVDAGDAGVFATLVPPGGSFAGDATIYDADLVDLTNDRRPDLVQVLAFSGGPRVRVLENRSEPGSAYYFEEATAAWLPSKSFSGNPDDLDHADVDRDGFVDVAVGLRASSTAEVLLNREGETFGTVVAVAGSGTSVHDVFFLDADADGFLDIVLVDESGGSGLFLNDGGATPGFLPAATFPPAVRNTGASADLDADGLPDVVLGGWNATIPTVAEIDVFLNDPGRPGTFRHVPLASPGPGILYDLELGDLDLDGDVDLVAAVLRLVDLNGDDAVVVWLNDGHGTFTDATAAGAGRLLPGVGPYQRLSADLVDVDLDGDLDLYVTGADLQFVGFGFGTVPNQLFENLRVAGP